MQLQLLSRGKGIRLSALTLVAGSALAFAAAPADGSILVTFSDVSGLSAEAEFTLVNPTTLQIRFKNTSTGVPQGFSNSDQILTGLSWDFGAPGFNGDNMIASGNVFTGPNSQSLNFDVQNVGPNEDVSGEWGFGNMDGTGALTNFITSNNAQATPFGGANLDGPDSIDGPQGGLVPNPEIIPLGGLGAIQDEVISTLTLTEAYTEAQLLVDFLANGVRVEFGSDAFFIEGIVPAPGALAIFGLAGLAARRRRRRA